MNDAEGGTAAVAVTWPRPTPMPAQRLEPAINHNVKSRVCMQTPANSPKITEDALSASNPNPIFLIAVRQLFPPFDGCGLNLGSPPIQLTLPSTTYRQLLVLLNITVMSVR